MSSESIEMYLVTIAMLGEEIGLAPIPLSRLADELSVKSVSANQMVRKLEKEELVIYLPYKGVELTKKGRERANNILRRRRLWEVFFVERLGFSPGEAEALACRMEHDTTLEVSERLANLLDKPIVSPKGKEIPASGKETQTSVSWRLSDLSVGQKGEITTFQMDDTTASFLQNEGLVPGIRVVVEAISSGGAILVEGDGKKISIRKEIANNIKITSSEEIKVHAN